MGKDKKVGRKTWRLSKNVSVRVRKSEIKRKTYIERHK